MIRSPRARAGFVSAIWLSIGAACGPSAPSPLEFRPVAADNVHRLETEVLPEADVVQPDHEIVDRTRNLVQRVAAQTGFLRESYAEQAKELGDKVANLLSGWISDNSQGPDARRAAMELLAALDTPRAGRALLYHARENPEIWVRSNCAWRLGDTHQDQCMVGLLEAWRGERDDEVRRSIGRALAVFGCYAHADAQGPQGAETMRRWRFGDPEGKLPSHAPSSRLQLEVWRAIASLSGTEAKERERTVGVLGDLPAFAAEMLSTALRDTSAEVRRGAARALAGMEMRGAVAGPTLHESLLRDPAVTLEAIEALGAVHEETAADDIAARVAADHPLEQRVAAARALGRLGVARTVPALESALKSGETETLRTAAAIALMGFGRESEALPVLAETMASSTADVSAVEASIEAWLQARAARGDERARSWLEKWSGSSATRESRTKLMRDEILR